jgi:[protein-PII] uridylyltransferase
LQSRFRKEVVNGTGMAFVEAKLHERDARHERLGDSRYVLEPNVKEDKGGLRDLHALNWISKYLYAGKGITDLVKLGLIHEDAAITFRKAYEFLWTVRCYIHFITGRAGDRLTFDLQPQLAEHMGYTPHRGGSAVERFMKHYFLIAKDGGTLTRVFSAVLEEKIKPKPIMRFASGFRQRKLEGFKLEGGRLSVNTADCFRVDPVNLLRVFHVAQKNSLDLHPRALELITRDVGLASSICRDQEANTLFLKILMSKNGPENSLRLMNESGVFGRFIPDFGRVVAQMQFDMYHVYTTDEHTIRAIGMLYKVEQGLFTKKLPIVSEIAKKIQSRRALYIAVFLHDIAKGRGGDHSKLGAEISKNLCLRLGLTKEETETVEWLVRYHLLMSETAFKRDLDDPKTISDFCMLVQSLERLKLLLVLTCVDIYEVGPKVWNDWKASLLRDLYRHAHTHISGGHLALTRDARISEASEKLSGKLASWPDRERDELMSLLPAPYFLNYNIDTQINYAKFVRRAISDGMQVATQFTFNNIRSITEMIIYAPDHSGLFAQITGSLALSGLSIVDAKALTLSNGMALDTFGIQDPLGGGALSKLKIDRLKKKLLAALEGRLHLEGEFRRLKTPQTERLNPFELPPRVIIDNSASKVFSIFEINGHDRPGLLFNITQAISKLGLQISSAHISTYGERVVDVFYVKDVFGMKVDNKTKILQVRDSLEVSIGLKNNFSVLGSGKNNSNHLVL